MNDFPRVWLFDVNYRVYGPDKSGPIWREHWRETRITGETKVSWITASGRRVPKKGGGGIAFSEVEIDRAAYVKVNRHRIADAVSRCADHDMLKTIAEMVGYMEREA